MFPGWLQIALVALLIILLFGRGKISDLMGDVAKGITSFRKGLKEDPAEAPAAEPKPVSDNRVIDGETVSQPESTEEKDKTEA